MIASLLPLAFLMHLTATDCEASPFFVPNLTLAKWPEPSSLPRSLRDEARAHPSVVASHGVRWLGAVLRIWAQAARVRAACAPEVLDRASH